MELQDFDLKKYYKLIETMMTLPGLRPAALAPRLRLHQIDCRGCMRNHMRHEPLREQELARWELSFQGKKGISGKAAILSPSTIGPDVFPCAVILTKPCTPLIVHFRIFAEEPYPVLPDRTDFDADTAGSHELF